MLKIFARQEKPQSPELDVWGIESTRGSSGLRYEFSASVRTAMTFVLATIHGKLPAGIEEHVRLDESSLPKEKVLYEINAVHDIADHGTGRYRDRTLRFAFSPSAHLDGTYVDVYLRQYAGNDTWKVMSMTYPRKCRGGGRVYEKYEVVITPHVENIGTEREGFVTSGFRTDFV